MLYDVRLLNLQKFIKEKVSTLTHLASTMHISGGENLSFGPNDAFTVYWDCPMLAWTDKESFMGEKNAYFIQKCSLKFSKNVFCKIIHNWNSYYNY